jgi:DoxX-like family
MMTAPATAAPPRRQTIAYWAITAIVVSECVIGGATDLFRLAPFYPALIALGYPSYLATILGIAKILAATVLLVPGLPRLKEWAYAGIVINMVGAAASYLGAHLPPANIIVPAAFAGLTLGSWALRPPARRL